MPVLKREIVYPIFIKCLSILKDDFWNLVFEEMAYNNCTNGTYISKGFFCSNVKGKEFSYKFEGKSEDVISKDIVKLLKEKMNIMSKDDRLQILNEIEGIENELKIYKTTDWTGIKKKSIKDIFIQDYLIDAKKQWELSDFQIKRIYNLINLGLMLKSIKNNDIIYNNGKIISIKGLSFCNHKYISTIDIYSIESKSNQENQKKKKLLKNL